MEWVRLFHDMPTDPKWRVIAKKSGQRIGDVIAVFIFVLTNASCNAMKRGETHGLVAEDIAAAIDLEEAGVTAILDAMEGKVVKNGALIAWEKRNAFQGVSSTERVRKHRETRCNALKRDETPITDTEQIQNRTELESSKGAASPLPAKQRAHSLPANFPLPGDQDAARAYWFERGRDDLSLDEEVAKFRAHHTAHGKRMADWPSAWVTWYSNAIKFNRKPKNAGQRTAHENFALGAYLAGDTDPH